MVKHEVKNGCEKIHARVNIVNFVRATPEYATGVGSSRNSRRVRNWKKGGEKRGEKTK